MNRANEALIASILDRWTTTHNPSANTTALATVAAVNNARHTLDTLIVSQTNMTAAAFTATLTVRDASIAGTILAQVDFVTAVNASDRFSEAKIGLQGLKNSALAIHFAPPAASVTQKITIAGYTQQEAY